MSENKLNNKTENNEKKNNKRMKIIAIVISAIIALFVVLCICVSAYDKMPNNTYISGIDVSGLSVSETEILLQEKIGDAFKDKKLKLAYNGELVELSVEEFEPVINTKSTAADVAQKRLGNNVFSKAINIIKSNFDRDENVLSITMNDEKLMAEVEKFMVNFEKPAKESSFELDGSTLKIYKGESGIEFNRDTVKSDIYNSVASLKFDVIDLRIENVQPKEVSLDDFYSQITVPATDAYYEKIDGQVVVNAGSPHIVVDKNKVAEALASTNSVTEISVTVEQPSLTKEYLESKIFIDKIGTHTSRFSTSNVGRSANVRLAASKINNYILLPGEVFSYDNTVGPRTAANGFKEAGVYIGNKVEQGIGGGICQVSSTLYSAALYANLEIVERTSHSLPVSYMPDGQDATIAQGYIDFKFKNNTAFPIKIVAYTNGGNMVCDLYGVKEEGMNVRVVHSRTSTIPSTTTRETDPNIPVGYKKITQKGAEGYRVASTRIVTVNGVETKREKLTGSVYNASPTIELVNPADVNTPTESLAIYSEQASVAEPTASPVPKTAENTETGQNASEQQAPQTPSENEVPTVSETPVNAETPTDAEQIPSINVD